MKTFFSIIIISVCLQANGQNLVPNSSFENYGTLPCSWITSQTGFSNAIQDWIMPTSGSTDIFSTLVNTTCFAHCLSTSTAAVGQQLPRTGNVMSAILTYGSGCGGNPDYREYLEIQLTSPLIVGVTYYAEMYVSHTDYSMDASNNIGMYFSNTLVNNPSICTELNFTPQINESSVITDDTNWVKISGTFVASSSAQYLIIGNFYDNNNTSTIFNSSNQQINARYFIDDVLVESVCLSTSPDTTICQGDLITLYAISNSLIGWAVDTLPNIILTSDSSLTVSPQFTTTYLVYSSCDTLSITVGVTPHPSINLGNDTTLCPGETLVLDATTPNTSYLWQDSSTSPTFNVMQQGTYWVQVTDSCGITADTINVTYRSLPAVDLGNDTTLCRGETLVLYAMTPNTSYLWQDSSSSPTFNVMQQGTYWVQVTDSCLNVAVSIITIEFKDCEIILEMPNVFTPNNDGTNDYFRPVIIQNIDQATIMIYNKWGQKLFESTDIWEGWNGKYNGKDCSDGTYYWIVYYSDINRKHNNVTGFLTLIR